MAGRYDLTEDVDFARLSRVAASLLPRESMLIAKSKRVQKAMTEAKRRRDIDAQ